MLNETEGHSPGKEKYTFFFIAFLIVVSCLAFGRIAGNDFINFDEVNYITENHHIQSGFHAASIKWAFTSMDLFNWHPVTWLSHMLDWRLFGANASGHHVVSLFFHIGAVIFLFLFLNKTTGNSWASVFAAAFFALHPLRVESVAWAAERKDVLSMFFGMVCLYAYSFYAKASTLSKYLLCLILFALALMSKPTMVTLPFVLLLLDYWPLGRWRKALSEDGAVYKSVGNLILEKVPLFCLAAASGVVTFLGQEKAGAITSIEYLSFSNRLANAVVSYIAYLGKIFWPVDLAVFYPYNFSVPLWKVIASAIILISISFAVIYSIRKLPFLFVGWFWYLGTLIPLIGLVQAGSQAIADRHTYLPSIGIAIMLTWGGGSVFEHGRVRKKIVLPAAIIVLAILAGLTWRQCGQWETSIKIWSHTLSVTEDNYMAHFNLGVALHQEGKYQEAIAHFNYIITMPYQIVTYGDSNNYSFYGKLYGKRGAAYTELGMFENAFEDFDKALFLNPEDSDIYRNRGYAYAKQNRHLLAIKDYNQAIRLRPDYAIYYNDRGNAYNRLGQSGRALDDYTKAISMNPLYAAAYNNRGTVYGKVGQYQHALEDFSKAVSIKPAYADAYNNRGVAYALYGDLKRSCRDLHEACKLRNCKTLEAAKKSGDCH